MCKTSYWTPVCLSVWKPLLFVCLNVINQFKDTQRAKAEQSRAAREGRREAAAFTVSHESLQPTALDLCHARSLLLSFFLSFFLSFLLTQSFYQCQVRPTEAPSQLDRFIWLLLLSKQEILWGWSATLNEEWEDDDEREEEEKERGGQDKHLIAMEIGLHSNSRGVGRCSTTHLC